MPFKQPIRDLSTVKCIKRSKDKSGEEKIEYLVLFDFVSVFSKCRFDMHSKINNEQYAGG